MNSAKSEAYTSLLNAIKASGIHIYEDGDALVFGGRESEFGGYRKPHGPLLNKRIGVLVASEFSDFQAYEIMHYVGEFGGICEFILVDWILWKNTRPAISGKGVEGQWGLHVDPIPTVAFDKAEHFQSLKKADPSNYDAIVILGNHSADIMLSEPEVWEFVAKANAAGALMGAIGEGTMPYIHTGIVNQKQVTGSRLVKFMLERVAAFRDEPVIIDQNLITARNTEDTPAFVRALAQYFDPNFADPREHSMNGVRALMICGEDYEDIEMCVPFLELLYRGANVIMGTFDPPMRSRPGMLGVDVVMGSVGTTIPVQEVPLDRYAIRKLDEIAMGDFDVIVIPGGFCPWNVIAAGYEKFIAEAYKAGKVVSAICHGPIAPAAAGILKGKKCAGVTQCLDAIPIMGGEWFEDRSAVIDGNIITARMPSDIPEYLDAINLKLLE